MWKQYRNLQNNGPLFAKNNAECFLFKLFIDFCMAKKLCQRCSGKKQEGVDFFICADCDKVVEIHKVGKTSVEE